ncbi:MAG TPA: hypothetical protein VIL20_23490 [Sandaracinaceae bacterium]
MSYDWEDNVFAGLEELDEEGRERLSQPRTVDETPDEPQIVASALPDFEEIDLGVAPRLA